MSVDCAERSGSLKRSFRQSLADRVGLGFGGSRDIGCSITRDLDSEETCHMTGDAIDINGGFDG